MHALIWTLFITGVAMTQAQVYAGEIGFDDGPSASLSGWQQGVTGR